MLALRTSTALSVFFSSLLLSSISFADITHVPGKGYGRCVLTYKSKNIISADGNGWPFKKCPGSGASFPACVEGFELGITSTTEMNMDDHAINNANNIKIIAYECFKTL